MFCKNCGKQLSIDEKFCSNCGNSVTLEQNLNTEDEINTSKIKNTKKGTITGIGPGIALIIGLVFLGIFINSTTSSTQHTNVAIEKVLDVNQFFKTANETISIDELISMYGEPENREDWNYTKDDNIQFPLITLYYNNSIYEYIFHNNMLVRININKNIQFNSQDDIFSMFNLSKHSITQIKNTGSSIRIYNSSVPDFWCGYDGKNIEWIKITYDTNIF